MSKPIIVRQQVNLELTEIPFTPLDVVQHLDVAQFAKAGPVKIEVGYFESDCCRRFVRAVVNKGMVTKLEADPCKDGGSKAPKEIAKLLGSLTLKGPATKRRAPLAPMPLGQFILGLGDIVIETWTCYRICMFGFCFTCCVENGTWTC